MIYLWNLIVAVQLFALISGVPIEEGEDVGIVQKKNGKSVVSGHNLYPYMVYVKIFTSKELTTCGGIIIGKRTVLTAAHCLYEKLNSHVIVQAGILHTKLEEDGGQKIMVKDHLIHESYQKKCKVSKNRYGFNVHDIAILWLEFDLKFGPNVQIAKLSETLSKPFKKEGWILGWGATRGKQKISMLQRGHMKVVSEAECKAYNQEAIVINSVICLKSIRAKTRTGDGDSGGPFVINGMVYGISSNVIYEKRDLRDWIDVYTYVPLYVDWIRKNQLAGPPRSRKFTSPKPKRKQ